MYIGILLAAGQSSRMGKPKGLLDWGGLPLLAHQINEMKKSRISQIVLVLGHNPEQYEPWIKANAHWIKANAHWLEAKDSHLKIVQNENWQDGKSSSIREGLFAIQETCEALIFVNVDQPVTAFILNSLISSYERGKSLIHIPVHQGKRGHPVLFSSVLMSSLKKVNEETQGLKSIIRNYVDHITEVKIDDPSIHFNFNTIQDYQGRNTD